ARRLGDVGVDHRAPDGRRGSLRLVADAQARADRPAAGVAPHSRRISCRARTRRGRADGLPRRIDHSRIAETQDAAAGHGGAARLYGNIAGNTTSVVKTHRSLCPHSGTMIVFGFAPSESVMNLTNASPRARRVGPCVMADGDESNPPSGSTSTWLNRYVVGRSASCFLSCASDRCAV